MIILGMHFGHDASVSVVVDGGVRVCIQAERHSRIKHSFPLSAEHVALALSDCGLEAKDIDYCSVTSSQPIPYLLVDTANLDLTIDAGQAAAFGLDPGLYLEKCRFYNGLPQRVLDNSLVRILPAGSTHNRQLSASFDPTRSHQRAMIPIEEFGSLEAWGKVNSFEDQRGFAPKVLLENSAYRNSFCLPVRVDLFGRSIPGLVFSHHQAHAATAFYLSGFDRSAVLTVDGAADFMDPRTYLGGMYYYGEGCRLVPLAPHRMPAGALYGQVAEYLFGSTHDAGKVMGLAPYGAAKFFDDAYAMTFPSPPFAWQEKMKWVERARDLATELGYDLTRAGSGKHALDPVNADLAASVQRIFEQTLLKGAGTLYHLVRNLGCATRNLSLAGGGALNCPTNSLLARATPFDRVFVPPACDDGGLSVGSALLVTHNVFGMPVQQHPSGSSRLAFVGTEMPDREIEKALEEAGDEFLIVDGASPRQAAEAVAEDQIVGCFEGRSEMGPRALGHRSILADPRKAANLDRVNTIKQRESWRPLAPAVLAEECPQWFADCPAKSPFMLFTGQVRSDRIPAVRHVDGSARIQTVEAGDGSLRGILEGFHERTGVPVVLNTSLNGPGEPICETPREALAFFRRSAIDSLLMNGRFWVTKRPG